MENLEIYNKVKEVPKNAQKKIGAGRLKGMTDINPMWRIKALTEQFGPCGIGWKYHIEKQWLEEGANGVVCAFCNIFLAIKVDDKWSEWIPGTGGSSYIAKESNGFHTSDEAYKMALTDALSVACKALGIGANIYWEGGRDSKYSQVPTEEYKCCECGKPFDEWINKEGKKFTAQQMYHISEKKNGKPLCIDCNKAKKEEAFFK